MAYYPPGKLGVSGYSGVSGHSGVSGYSGVGLSGYSGAEGISGYSGFIAYVTEAIWSGPPIVGMHFVDDNKTTNVLEEKQVRIQRCTDKIQEILNKENCKLIIQIVSN